MTEALIIDACRTPRGIGKVGKGALADIHPQQLASTVLKALAERNNLNTAEVDDILWGTSSQRGKQGGDMGRMAALDAGYDTKASGMTLDRFCGSGITTVNLAAASIMSGMEDLVIAGGCEMMSYTSSLADPAAGPPVMDAGNLHLRKLPSPDPAGRLRRRHRHHGGHRPPGAGRAGPGQPAARRRGDQGRPLQPLPGAGLQGRRLAGPRPRGVSAPADHPRGPVGAEGLLRGHRQRAGRRRGHHLRRPDPQGLSGPEDRSTCTTPAIRRAWSTAPAACCWPRRPTPPSTA